MKELIKTVLIIALFMLPSVHAKAASQCPELYPNGIVIEVPNTQEFCNTEYVAVYDPGKHANIFSAEKFDPVHTHADRLNNFHVDSRAPLVTPSDYNGAHDPDDSKVHYDRGHQAPAADMTSEKEMTESFLMTNMTPQVSTLNRESWRMLEEHIRSEADGTTYVITIAHYGPNPKTISKHKIPVPDAYYKCAWFNKKEVLCYTAKNEQNAKVESVDISTVNRKTGLNLK